MRSEYKREELGVGIRGKYFEEYQKPHNVVLLEPEVAEVFLTDEAVNNALMSLIKVAKMSTGLTKGLT
ncbi:MAG: hypothetical protein AAF669_06705 [Pseudomonadota bacterium]